MPWKETCTMKERQQFIDAWLSQRFTVVELCERFGISRKTGYKWINRFREAGLPGLVDQSRARHTQAQRTSEEIETKILALKNRYPNWGPVTIRSALFRELPQGDWPASSTIGDILKRHGLVKRKKPRRKTPAHTQPLAHAKQPNDVWSADYKGHFRLGNGQRCYPLTITDNYSRLLIDCKGLLGPQLRPSMKVYEQAFREYGLPTCIRTDNGWPFAMTTLGGLTPLSIWLLKLGVYPERIAPGCPQQNGRHERMHRTLKAQTMKPPKGNLSAQQRAFNQFIREYNEVRPHHSLGLGRCPVDVYCASKRAFPSTLPEPVYNDDYEVRKVKCGGYIKLHGQPIYTTRQLVGEYVGLEPIGYDRWQLYFAQLKLGIIDERIGRVIRPS